MIPMLVLLKTYPWPNDSYGIYKMVFICVVLAILGLIPSAIFYAGRTDIWSRMRNLLISVGLLIAMGLFLVPSTAPKVIEKAADVIGIRNLAVNRYMIKEDYAVGDFDEIWRPEARRGFPVISGFKLFALGDLVLMCPRAIASTSLDDWPQVTQVCLILSAKKLLKM